MTLLEQTAEFSNVAQARREIAGATTRDSVNDQFRRAARSFGFTAYAIGYVPDSASGDGGGARAAQPFLLLDWPVAWLELYARQGFAANDIVVAHAAQTSTPFTWSQARARFPGASEHIFAAASGFGWNDGFVVPVHDPRAPSGERFGVASLAAPDLSRFEPPARRALAALTLTAFARARALSNRPADERRTALSDRERQAIALVAEGFNDAEIGDILAISKSTAHFHVENARKRLGARTRAQTVAIALIRGLL